MWQYNVCDILAININWIYIVCHFVLETKTQAVKLLLEEPED